MKGKYDVAYRNHIARSEVRPAADTEVAQDPVDGLNRAVSVEDGKSASRALDKSKTGHKSLRNRIGNLWLVRKISALFKKLSIHSRKDVESAGRKVAGSMSVADCTVVASSLARNVCSLGEAVEAQDPPFDEWTEAGLNIRVLMDELDQLNRNISALKSCQPDSAGEEIAHLVSQKNKTGRRIDWIIFYIEDSKEDGYYNCNMRYYDTMLKCFYNAAEKALEGNDVLLDGLGESYRNVRSLVDEKIKNGHAFAVMETVEEFSDDILKLVDSVNQRSKYQLEFNRQIAAGVPEAEDT